MPRSRARGCGLRKVGDVRNLQRHGSVIGKRQNRISPCRRNCGSAVLPGSSKARVDGERTRRLNAAKYLMEMYLFFCCAFYLLVVDHLYLPFGFGGGVWGGCTMVPFCCFAQLLKNDETPGLPSYKPCHFPLSHIWARWRHLRPSALLCVLGHPGHPSMICE